MQICHSDPHLQSHTTALPNTHTLITPNISLHSNQHLISNTSTLLHIFPILTALHFHSLISSPPPQRGPTHTSTETFWIEVFQQRSSAENVHKDLFPVPFTILLFSSPHTDKEINFRFLLLKTILLQSPH